MGIRKVKSIDINDFSYFDKKDKAYSYIYDDGKLPEKEKCGWDGPDWGVKCENGDIIKMTLNMNDLTLSYQVNDKDLGKAYENIENTAYRAAVTMEQNSSLTLMRFEQI